MSIIPGEDECEDVIEMEDEGEDQKPSKVLTMSVEILLKTLLSQWTL